MKSRRTIKVEFWSHIQRYVREGRAALVRDRQGVEKGAILKRRKRNVYPFLLAYNILVMLTQQEYNFSNGFSSAL